MNHLEHLRPRMRDTGGTDGKTQIEIIHSIYVGTLPTGTFVESVLRLSAPLDDTVVTAGDGIVTVRGWRDATGDEIRLAAQSRAKALSARENACEAFPLHLRRAAYGV